MRKTCVCYARTSTKKQRDALTIEAQVDVCRGLVKEHALTMLDYGDHGWVKDDGRTGTLLEERNFARLLDDLRAKRIKPDYIVVAELSRLCRIDKYSTDQEKLDISHEAAAKIAATLIGANVQIIDADGIVHPASLEFQLKAVHDNIEITKIRRRTMHGKATRLANGSASMGSRPPFGYVLAPIGSDRRKGLRWVPHPEQAHQLRQIFAWFIEGGCTYAAKMATEAKFKTPAATADRKNKARGWSPTGWHSNTVEHIVKKLAKVYRGSATFMFAGQSYTIKYEPLIDAETFHAVVRKSKERALPQRAIFLSTGYTDCKCGQHLQNRNSGQSGGGVLHFTSCRKGCGSMRSENFERYLWRAVVKRFVQVQKMKIAKDEHGVDPVALDAAKVNVKAVQGKIEKLAVALENGLHAQVWKARNDVLNQSLALAQAEVDKLMREQESHERRRTAAVAVKSKVNDLVLNTVGRNIEFTLGGPGIPLDQQRRMLGDLLQEGDRVIVSWGPRQNLSKKALTVWASLTFPTFGSLPAETMRTDQLLDPWAPKGGYLADPAKPTQAVIVKVKTSAVKKHEVLERRWLAKSRDRARDVRRQPEARP